MLTKGFSSELRPVGEGRWNVHLALGLYYVGIGRETWTKLVIGVRGAWRWLAG